MAMVSPSAPRTNRTHSEMVPERCLTLALERLLASRLEGILVNPVECGEIGLHLLRAASSSMRRLGALIVSPFCPNGVTIRSQGTKAPVKTLEARDRRSPLTTWRMSRIAKGSYREFTV